MKPSRPSGGSTPPTGGAGAGPEDGDGAREARRLQAEALRQAAVRFAEIGAYGMALRSWGDAASLSLAAFDYAAALESLREIETYWARMGETEVAFEAQRFMAEIEERLRGRTGEG
ncbi:MAG: hypothetical protein KC645_08010 [Gemmatimonadetes bacterium]|nr:hypothetical protein [Gemmatimonadota bacterium]